MAVLLLVGLLVVGRGKQLTLQLVHLGCVGGLLVAEVQGVLGDEAIVGVGRRRYVAVGRKSDTRSELLLAGLVALVLVVGVLGAAAELCAVAVLVALESGIIKLHINIKSINSKN